MLGNSAAVVVVVVVRTRPRAIPLAMITMRKSTHGFLFFPIWVWRSAWRPLGLPELRYEGNLLHAIQNCGSVHNNASFKWLAGERSERIKKGEDKTTELNEKWPWGVNACGHQWPYCYPKEKSQIIDRAVKRWSQVPRRKLPKVQCSTPMHVTSVTTGSNWWPGRYCRQFWWWGTG